MSLHKETSFETEICQHLADNGWLYAEGDAANYDRARALFPADVLAWVQERRTALISAAVTGQIDVRQLSQTQKIGAGGTTIRSGESSAA